MSLEFPSDFISIDSEFVAVVHECYWHKYLYPVSDVCTDSVIQLDNTVRGGLVLENLPQHLKKVDLFRYSRRHTGW